MSILGIDQDIKNRIQTWSSTIPAGFNKKIVKLLLTNKKVAVTDVDNNVNNVHSA